LPKITHQFSGEEGESNNKRAMGSLKNKRKKKTRVFQGNRYSNQAAKKTVLSEQQQEKNAESEKQSTSSKKLNISLEQTEHVHEHNDFFFFCHFHVLKNMVATIGSCQECQSNKLDLTYIPEEAKGFASPFCITCPECDWSYKFLSSPEFCLPGRDKRGAKSKEVNIRATMAFREIGKGHEDMKTFSTIMNMPPPMAITSYNEMNTTLLDFYESACNESMQDAVAEMRHQINPSAAYDDIVDCQIGIDGSWQKRGHSSLNGVCTAVEKTTKKVIDYQVLSKFCRGCAMRNNKKDTEGYEEFIKNHKCDINHFQSSGAMESAGAMSFFTESISKYKLRYSHYIGDGDTESFKKVVAAKPYGDDLVPIKSECVGHVQKRLGTRLRKVRNDYKGKKLADGKSISGKGRLTDKLMNKMQNCYGMAIRQNSLAHWNGDRNLALYSMKKSVLAVLWHCTYVPDNEERHKFCPRTEDSWCKYWQGDKDHKPSVNLPIAIKDVLIKTFVDLRADDLLSRCLDGATQNPNEAFNQIIWKKCPKSVFVTKKILEMGVASAVINYNDGLRGFQRVFTQLQIPPGSFMLSGSLRKDIDRVKNMDKKTQVKQKSRRKKLRSIKKGYTDQEKHTEGGDSYVSGQF